jgi:hypothetical protein
LLRKTDRGLNQRLGRKPRGSINSPLSVLRLSTISQKKKEAKKKNTIEIIVVIIFAFSNLKGEAKERKVEQA